MNSPIEPAIALSPLVLAQVSGADPSAMLTVLLGGAALAVIANQVLQLWRNATRSLKVEPPPAGTYRTISDCAATHDKLAAEIAAFRAAFAAAAADLDGKAELRAAKLHARIDPIAGLGQATAARLDDHLRTGAAHAP